MLAAHGITERELAIAKGNLRADALLACEDSGARMTRVGSSMLLHDEAPTVDEQLAHVEGVGLADVLRVARGLAGAPRVLAAVGPFGQDDFDPAALGLSG
jgi:predicted Zn-dependent peptidase